eukprot:COSAG06_NODE_41404_length_392_cov_0.440273_2_plen_32_part_01
MARARLVWILCGRPADVHIVYVTHVQIIRRPA